MRKFDDLDDNGKVKVRNDDKKPWGCLPILVCCMPVVAFLLACFYLVKDATPAELKANEVTLTYWQNAKKMAASVTGGAAANKGTEKNFDEYKDEPKAPRIEYVEPNEKTMKELFSGIKLPQGFSTLGQDLIILPVSLI